MVVVIAVAAVVVIAAVVFVAIGRGGQLSAERSDYLPIDLGPVSATDVALLRPPTGLWGYNMQATDEAMERIADSIRERDVRIVALEQLVTDLSREPAPTTTVPLSSPYGGARHRRTGEFPVYGTGGQPAYRPEPAPYLPGGQPPRALPTYSETYSEGYRAPEPEATAYRVPEPEPAPSREPAPLPAAEPGPEPEPFRAVEPQPAPSPAGEQPPQTYSEGYRRWAGEPAAPADAAPAELPPPEQAHD